MTKQEYVASLIRQGNLSSQKMYEMTKAWEAENAEPEVEVEEVKTNDPAVNAETNAGSKKKSVSESEDTSSELSDEEKAAKAKEKTKRINSLYSKYNEDGDQNVSEEEKAKWLNSNTQIYDDEEIDEIYRDQSFWAKAGGDLGLYESEAEIAEEMQKDKELKIFKYNQENKTYLNSVEEVTADKSLSPEEKKKKLKEIKPPDLVEDVEVESKIVSQEDEWKNNSTTWASMSEEDVKKRFTLENGEFDEKKYNDYKKFMDLDDEILDLQASLQGFKNKEGMVYGNMRTKYDQRLTKIKGLMSERGALLQPYNKAKDEEADEIRESAFLGSKDRIKYRTEQQVNPEALETASTYLPKDFEGIEDDVELDKIMKESYANFVKDDPILKAEWNAIQKSAQGKIKAYQNEILKTADLTTEEGVAAANSKLEAYAKKITLDVFENSDTYNQRLTDLGTVMDRAMSNTSTAYKRQQSYFLNFTDMLRGGNTGIEGNDFIPFNNTLANVIESIGKGGVNLVSSGKKALASVEAKGVRNVQREIDDINERYEKGEIDEKTRDQLLNNKRGGKGQFNSLIEELMEDKEDVEKLFDSIQDDEAYTNLFNTADLSDGISFQDAIFTTGEALPQIGLAVAGTLTGNPVMAGLGTAAMFTQMYGDNYWSAYQQGIQMDAKAMGIDLNALSPEERREFELNALNEGKHANMATSAAFAAVMTAAEQFGANKILKQTEKALGLGTGGLVSFYKGSWREGGEALLRGALNKAEAGATEFATEWAQEVLGQIGTGLQTTGNATDFLDWGASLEAGKAGGVVGIMIPFAKAVSQQSAVEIRNISRDVAIKFAPNSKYGKFALESEKYFEAAQTNLDNKLKNNQLTKQQYQEESQNLSDVRNSRLKIDSNAGPDVRARQLDLMVERNKLIREIKKMDDPDLTVEQQERLNQVKTQLRDVVAEQNLYNKSGQVRKMIQNAGKKDAQGKPMIEFRDVQTAKETQEVADQLEKEGYTKAATSATHGVQMINEKTGKEVLLINNEVASGKGNFVGNVNVGAHEFLHTVLKKTLDNNPEAAIEMENEMRGYFKKLLDSGKLDMNSEYALNLQQYMDKPLAEQAEEAMTLFADGLANGDIVLNESNLQKIKDILRRLMQSLGIKNVEFNTGKDVFNFLKDYNKSVERGKLNRAQKKLLDKSAEGKLLTKESKDTQPKKKSKKSKASNKDSKQRAKDPYRDAKTKKEAKAIERRRRRILKAWIDGDPKLQATFADWIGGTKYSKAREKAGIPQAELDLMTPNQRLALEGRLPYQLVRLASGKMVMESPFVGKAKAIAQLKATLNKRIPKDSRYSIARTKQTPLEAINDLIPSEIKTKDQFDTFIRDNKSAKAIADALMPGGVINNLIRSQETSREQGDKMIDEMYERIFNFNPEAKRTDGTTVGPKGFGEAIFANSRFAKMVANKALFQESEKKKQEKRQDDTTQQIADKGEALDLGPANEGYVLAQKPSKTTGLDSKTEDAITKAVNKTFKGEDIRFADTRNIPQEVADIYGKMFGINPETIVNKKRNFQTTDAEGLTKAKQFLLKNAKNDFDRLPKVQDDTGRGTFVPKNVKDALYTDGKLTGSLKDYMDLIREKPVKPIYRDRVGQTIRGLLGLHIRNRVLETAQPVQGKRIQSGAKFSIARKKLSGTKAINALLEEKGNVETNLERRVINNKDFVEDFENKSGLPIFITQKSSNFTNGKRAGAKGNDLVITEEQHNDPAQQKANKLAIAKGTSYSLRDASNKAKAKSDFKITEQKYKDEKGKTKRRKVYSTSQINVVTGKPFTSQELKDLELVMAGKNEANIEKNLENEAALKRGQALMINIMAAKYKALKSNPKTEAEADVLLQNYKELLYNSNLNSNMGRNMAATIGKEKGSGTYIRVTTKKGEKKKIKNSTEEHTYQAINFAYRTLEAISDITNPHYEANLKGWTKWAGNNYYQIIVTKKTDGTLDATYYKDIFDAGKDLTKYNPKSKEYPLLKEALDNAFETGDWSSIPDSDVRYFNPYVSINPNTNYRNDVTYAKYYDVEIPKKLLKNANAVLAQKQALYRITSKTMRPASAKAQLTLKLKTATAKESRARVNSKVASQILKPNQTTQDQKRIMLTSLDTKVNAFKIDPEPKGISVFDFDDTLAKTKEKVIVIDKNGKRSKISASQFAVDAVTLEKQGAEFDFSNFEGVSKGTKKGPLADLALKRQDKFGSSNIFVLTARPQVAATSIKTFLDGIGLNIPLDNITGLEDGSAQAKADWVLNKTAEGFNDFYFADDSFANIAGVKAVLDGVDVKNKVHLAKQSKARKLNKDFNKILEEVTGTKAYKKYSTVRARLEGKKKDGGLGKRVARQFTITPSADDFAGLTYAFRGEGEQGNRHQEWIEKNLIKPYNKAELELMTAKITLANDFAALKKQFPSLKTRRNMVGIKRNPLLDQIGVGPYTKSQAVRVYMWAKQGMDIEGMSKRDVNALVKAVKADNELQVFADEVILIMKDGKYPPPSKNWLAGDMKSDILNVLDKGFRQKLMAEFNENADIVFSPENLNKLEALYGSTYVEALRDSLRRMKSGSNRPVYQGGGSRMVNDMLDWLNASVGVTMFINQKSGLLQTLSAVNFINWGDNNIYAAAKAFASKDFYPTFIKLMNSDYLVNRRDGLKINVNEAELVDAGRKGGFQGMVSYLLDKGFIITRIMDSLAIASGGATFFINRKAALQKRVNPETGKLYTESEADAKAFEDFYAIAEETQQSSNPSKISQQQASIAGRVLLSFQNVTMQFNRKTKKSILDFVKRRRKPGMTQRESDMSNLSSVMYYVGMQNLIFHSLQQALFGMLFEGDEEEDKGKTASIANSMLDSLLFGLGFGGAGIATIKNLVMRMYEEYQKKSPDYEDPLWDIFDVSPVIDSKIRKLRSAAKSFSWNMKEIKRRGWSLDNPAYLAISQIISAAFNLPIDRVMTITNNMRNAMDEETRTWQKIALVLGWSPYILGLPYWGRQSTIDKEAKEDAKLKENYKKQIQRVKKKGFTKKIPLSGPNHYKPEGQSGVDFMQVERPDGTIQYYVKP